MKLSWVCTDPNTFQYGRKISNWVYEFKELLNKEEVPDILIREPFIKKELWDKHDKWKYKVIDLSEYSAFDIEECIRSYGFTLDPSDDSRYIFHIYKNIETVNWIIAECLFETIPE